MILLGFRASGMLDGDEARAENLAQDLIRVHCCH